MSAFMVSQEHIDAMVALALYGPRDGESEWRGVSWRRDVEAYEVMPEIAPGVTSTIQWIKPATGGLATLRSSDSEMTAEEIGDMLWAENAASVRFRYDDADEAHMLDEFYAGYEYGRPAWPRIPLAVEGFKLLACFEYQSCEHPEWETSEAARFCESLRSALTAQLPGYDTAPWAL